MSVTGLFKFSLEDRRRIATRRRMPAHGLWALKKKSIDPILECRRLDLWTIGMRVG
jgi:hypothetical protein